MPRRNWRTGVYCPGDDCHNIPPKWERPVAEALRRDRVVGLFVRSGFGSAKAPAAPTRRFNSGTRSRGRVKLETRRTPQTVEIRGEDGAQKTVKPVAGASRKASR